MSDLAGHVATALTRLGSRAWASTEALVVEYAEFLAADPDRVYRRGPEHFTASGMIFTPDLTRTLLCFHGKGRFWVQLGGHLEPGDPTPAAGAMREAFEESSLINLRLIDDDPIDLNRHDLQGSFGTCRTHWDLVYALASPPETPAVSPESVDVRWFDVTDPPADCAPGFADQLAQVLHRLRAH